jgi:hypothetical protein
MKREFRVFKGFELRATPDGRGITGHAAVFNQRSEDLGGFQEEIAPGAFDGALAAGADVRALINHNPEKILGRTKSGTLRCKTDDVGLSFDCDTPDTQYARDLHVSIARRDIDACSFGFRVGPGNAEWSEEKTPDGGILTIRRINKIAELFDVSPVTFPAYPQTDVSARALWPDGVPDEVAEHRKTAPPAENEEPEEQECECRCRACYDQECEEHELHMVDGVDCLRFGDEERASRATEKKSKRVDGEDLPASSFLFVGDKEKTETWKLPWKFSSEEKTKSHLRNALARFNQTQGIPAEKKKEIYAKLTRLCKKYGIHVEGEDSLRADDAADDLALASLISKRISTQ